MNSSHSQSLRSDNLSASARLYAESGTTNLVLPSGSKEYQCAPGKSSWAIAFLLLSFLSLSTAVKPPSAIASPDSITAVQSTAFQDKIGTRQAIAEATTSTQAPAAEAANYAPLLNAVDRAQKHKQVAEEADALYDLAKAHFDNKDFIGADTLMRQALTVESTLKRPAARERTTLALALILVGEGKGLDALAIFDQAIAEASQNKLDDDLASLTASKASVLLSLGRLDDAEACLNQAISLADAKKDTMTKGSALINLAVVARAQHKLDKAENHLRDALACLKDHADGKTLGSVWMEIGRCQSDQGKTKQAIESYQQAAKESEEDFDTAGVGKAQLAIGQIQLTSGDLTQAQATLRKARESLSAEGGQSGALIDCDTTLAAALTDAGNYQEAGTILSQASSLADTNKSSLRKRSVLSQLGYLQLLKGNKEEALTTYLEADALTKQAGAETSKSEAILLSDIALVYKSLGQAPVSISYLERALPIFKASDDKQTLATAVNNLAVAYLDSGNSREFDKLYNYAKEIYASLPESSAQATSAGHVSGLTILTYNLAQYKIVRGDYAGALPLYQECLTSAKNQTLTGDTKIYRQILTGLGLAYLLNGETDKALATYQEANALADKLNDLEAKWDCQLGMGKCYHKLKDLPQAYSHLQTAVDLVERERAQLTKDTFKTYNLDLRQDCFNELIDLLVEQGKAEEALVVAERGRARAFLDMLEGRKAKLPSSLAADSSAITGDAADTTATNQTTLASGLQNAATSTIVNGAAKRIALGDFSQSTSAKPPDLNEIKAIAAKQKAVIIEYYLLPDKLITWMIAPDGQIKLAVPVSKKHSEWSTLVADAYQAIIARPRDFSQITASNQKWTKSLQNLYELIIAPLEPTLTQLAAGMTNNKSATLPNLIIVPHGPLFSIPFAALLDKNQNYLIEKTTLSYVPAIGVLRATSDLAQAHQKTAEKLVAFGNPINPNFAVLGPLPYAEKEVEQVAKLFGADKSQVFIGKDATINPLKQYGNCASALHLAMHGLINEMSPMDSGLVMSPVSASADKSENGLLTARDILALPAMNCKIAVLSACQSGRGRITGDGVVGLSRSFIIAGAPSVLVSQWNVDDAVTQIQMVSFYSNYLKGNGAALSLGEAQRKTITLLEGGADNAGGGNAAAGKHVSPRANPRLWSAFQLIGHGY